MEGDAAGSTVLKVTWGQVLDRAVGNCPMQEVTIGGIVVPALLDSGSQVSTISESFFRRHFSDRELLETYHWLTLTAANGLDIPYIGYLEMDVQCLGRINCARVVLVATYGPESLRNRRGKVPGVIGMNVLQCVLDGMHEAKRHKTFQGLSREVREMFSHLALGVWQRWQGAGKYEFPLVP